MSKHKPQPKTVKVAVIGETPQPRTVKVAVSHKTPQPRTIKVAVTHENRERPAYLVFWFKNGVCCRYDARVPADTKVSIGRTDSKRALGFIVKQGDKSLDFVLDKDQVAELAAYLRAFSRVLLKPLGRKKPQLSIAAMVADRERS